ncbi:unnamed protein product [Darwinula stevensoni]|uniref:Uncharacterized protein n=1 Tax=Darwinula stevensoni TaxID=69355 RepID=A0A7R8XAS9_9CRUS|nr:unnamed protein product [Darwinula stevensoni]CAG0890318.1 unnamed protein product [Darwinula stevensoni]
MYESSPLVNGTSSSMDEQVPPPTLEETTAALSREIRRRSSIRRSLGCPEEERVSDAEAIAKTKSKYLQEDLRDALENIIDGSIKKVAPAFGESIASLETLLPSRVPLIAQALEKNGYIKDLVSAVSQQKDAYWEPHIARLQKESEDWNQLLHDAVNFSREAGLKRSEYQKPREAVEVPESKVNEVLQNFGVNVAETQELWQHDSHLLNQFLQKEVETVLENVTHFQSLIRSELEHLQELHASHIKGETSTPRTVLTKGIDVDNHSPLEAADGPTEL